MFRSRLTTALASSLLLAVPAAAQQEAIFTQYGDTTALVDTAVESSSPGFTGHVIETADDFDVVGSVERLYVVGNDCFQCVTPMVLGVHVRFYEWNGGVPGALQQAYFLPAGDPGLQYFAGGPAALDITLPQPFAASGQHFVSVQMEMDGFGYWGWWTANFTAGVKGSRLWTRSDGGEWVHEDTPIGPLNDLAFSLWGTDATPPDPGSDPNGQWVVAATPNLATDHAILDAVEVIAPDDIWAVGNWSKLVQPPFGSDTLPLAMHFDGTSWTPTVVPFKNLFSPGNWCELQAVRAAGSNDVWAAGSVRKQAPDGYVGTHLFVTHWNGSTWTEVPAPVVMGGSGTYVQDIAVIAPNDVWFVGDWLDTQGGLGVGLQKALTMHWDGSSFTIFENPFFNNNPNGGHGLTAISALASNDIWAVGGGHDEDYVGYSEITHWNGSTWEYKPGPAPGWFHRLYGVAAIAHDDVWACGDYQDATGYHVFFTHWNGSAWTMVDSDAPGGGSALVAFGPNEVYSAGGGIVRWDGSSWHSVATFPSVLGPSLLSIGAAGGTDTLWAVGRQQTAAGLQTLGVRLAAGDTWTSIGVGAAGVPGNVAPAAQMAGSGEPVAGQSVLLTLAGAQPTSPTLLVVGLHAAMAPLKGSLLVPSPDLIVPGVVTSAAGFAHLPAAWPAGVPAGLHLWMQFWSAGPGGMAGSDGLRVTTP